MKTLLAVLLFAAAACSAQEHPFDFTLADPAAQDRPPAEMVPVEKQPTPIEGQTPGPIYPDSARRAGIQGTVWIKLWVDETGKVRKAQVIQSDNEIFNQATVEAAIQWKFTPALIKNKPVGTWVQVPFKFKLGKKGLGKPDGLHKPAPPAPTPVPK